MVLLGYHNAVVVLFVVILMTDLIYLRSYPETIQQQVRLLLQKDSLGDTLKRRYPDENHNIQTDKALYELTLQLKQQFMKSSDHISKVQFDPKIHVIHNALGTHSQISRVQGGKLKSKNTNPIKPSRT